MSNTTHDPAIGVSSADSRARDDVAQCNLTPDVSPLRIQRRTTNPLRDGPTAPWPMGIE
jgi:hypothetical protein